MNTLTSIEIHNGVVVIPSDILRKCNFDLNQPIILEGYDGLILLKAAESKEEKNWFSEIYNKLKKQSGLNVSEKEYLEASAHIEEIAMKVREKLPFKTVEEAMRYSRGKEYDFD